MTTTRLVFNTNPRGFLCRCAALGGCGLIVICIVVAAVLLTVVLATRTCCVGVCLVLAH